MNTINDLCNYGCGQLSNYKFDNGKYCCSSHYSKCPAIKKRNGKVRKGVKLIRRNFPKNIESNNFICDFGCNQKASYQLVNGKYCCSSHQSKCPKIREILSIVNTGKSLTEETKKKLSITSKKPCKEETKEKISKSQIGKIITKESRKKMSLSQKKRKIDPRKGTHHSEKTRKKLSDINRLTVDEIKERFPFASTIEWIEETDIPGKYKVHCKNNKCKNSKEKGGYFIEDYYTISHRLRTIESGGDGLYIYCSLECKLDCNLYNKKVSQLLNAPSQICHTQQEYDTWRQEVLKRADYKCEYCGELAEHCHHIKPQKLEPFFSLDPDFGIACCKKCHYEKGHKDECSTGKLANI